MQEMRRYDNTTDKRGFFTMQWVLEDQPFLHQLAHSVDHQEKIS